MAKLTKMLKDFIEDPSKIEALAEILDEAETLEKSELEAYTQVEKTQASNRALLQRIVAQPDEPSEKKEEPVTAADITNSLVSEMYGGNE